MYEYNKLLLFETLSNFLKDTTFSTLALLVGRLKGGAPVPFLPVRPIVWPLSRIPS